MKVVLSIWKKCYFYVYTISMALTNQTARWHWYLHWMFHICIIVPIPILVPFLYQVLGQGLLPREKTRYSWHLNLCLIIQNFCCPLLPNLKIYANKDITDDDENRGNIVIFLAFLGATMTKIGMPYSKMILMIINHFTLKF